MSSQNKIQFLGLPGLPGGRQPGPHTLAVSNIFVSQTLGCP